MVMKYDVTPFDMKVTGVQELLWTGIINLSKAVLTLSETLPMTVKHKRS